ncbi:LTA synthase family protein [Dysgonomonas sp. HDW5B]|uniref:LTA synthase family protein n=1 Tax=Dysgonomonas sp. HDW5B TaxID=2714927 RepID=UPI0021077AE6|nr:LTA synthase family protein [Dysgonomonas sp. HDW5B]
MISGRQNTLNGSNKNQTKLFTSTLLYLIIFSLSIEVIEIIAEIILLLNPQTQIAFSFTDWIQIFLLGIINDVCITTIAFFFMWLNLIFRSQSKYYSPWGYIIFGLIAAVFVYITFFNTIFDEYGSVVSKIVWYFLLYKLLSFGLRLFIPAIRKNWSIIIYYFILFLYIITILTNAIGEYFFWDEFGVRYNFIAVDYLIYTNEVIGNILESYPIVPLFSILVIISVAITYFIGRKTTKTINNIPSFKNKLVVSALYCILLILSGTLLNINTHFQNKPNVYVNELQASGVFKFYMAFMNSELDYNKFYVTLPQKETIEIINNQYNSQGINNIQVITDTLPEVHKNIVLITIESLSASFLAHYGNTDNITPNLDKLMDESLSFTNLFATGNRTVRGLEAVTLSLPPSAGESIIKRPNNQDLFSTGEILKDKGYTVQYLYGGDSYFDNMETFFSGNGYDIIDKKDFTKDEISFSNIWGVCDEDMYNKALGVFSKNAEMGKPFFGHIMTVSNHRPFTYPENKIDIPTNIKSRNGGVKYTDYAIGKFMDEARKQPWFDNTIFVIVADHCASSAGKTEIPLDKYHIPALIYSPGFIEPKQVNTLTSQIDIMPTVFGLLHFTYKSQFYGKNVFSPDYKPRAFVATYQNLGYLESDILTILSPIRKVEQYKVQQKANLEFNLSFLDKTDSLYLKNAIANYQTVGYQQIAKR